MSDVVNQNLVWLYDQSDRFDRNEGKQAYFRYHLLMRQFAEHYGFSLDRTVAAFAALSPNSDYYGNLRSLASLLDGINRGAPVSQITVSTYKHCAHRAYRFATGQSDFLTVTKGLKTRAFYKNILEPWNEIDVTIDGHMVAAFKGEQMTMKEAKMTSGLYRKISFHVQMLARNHGLLPHQMQATLWFTRKRIYNIKHEDQLALPFFDASPENVPAYRSKTDELQHPSRSEHHPADRVGPGRQDRLAFPPE